MEHFNINPMVQTEVIVKGSALHEGIIYTTHDYEFFSTLNGNREDISSRASRLERDIMSNEQNQDLGILPAYVIINENAEVIEGQARLLALKHLDKDVQFIVKRGLRLSHTIRLNKNSTKWNTYNYIHAYAATGNESYKQLELLHRQYGKDIPLSVIAKLCTGSISVNHCTKSLIDSGEFEVTQSLVKVRKVLDDLLTYIDAIKEYKGKLGGRTDVIYSAFIFLIVRNKFKLMKERGTYDKKRLLHNLSDEAKSAPLVTTSFKTIKDALFCLSQVYNYKLKLDRNKLDLHYDYDTFVSNDYQTDVLQVY